MTAPLSLQLNALIQFSKDSSPDNAKTLADAVGITLVLPDSTQPEIIEHVTAKGKTIRGVVRTDLSKEQAQAIDAYTFKKNGGWFIREKHFGQGQESKPVTAQSEPIASVKSDVLVSDQDNGIDALKVKFKPASSQYKTASIRFDPKDGAKLLKQTLTKLFPDTKFSVVMGRGTGYGSVDVSWIDGASIDLVSVVTDHFQGKGFSSIDDSTIYKNSVNEAGEVVDYGLGYVSYRRTYSKGFLERFLKNIPENLKRWVVQYGVGVDGSDSDAYLTKINEYWAKKELYDALRATSTGKYRLGNTPKTNNNPQAIEAEVLPAEQAQIDADIEAKAEILEKYGFINNVTGRWKYNTENGGYPRFTANSKQGAVEAVWPYFLKVPKNELRTAEGKFNDANVRLIEEMDKRYGHLSDDEIVKLIGRLGGEIASLQSAGQQEMDGLGGRRTGAAVANEGARATGQERMHLEIYLRNRKEAADKATNTFNSTAYNRPLSEKLALLRQFADNPNDENAQALADAVGVKIKPVYKTLAVNEDETQPAQNDDDDPLGFDLFGDPIQDDEESPVEELPRLAVVELPLNKLTLSEDVPQFKSGADGDTGVVEALGGKFDRTGVAPIQVWERTDGRLEIISGRHRTDLARRSGEKTIPAQVHKESEGFDARRAMMLDAELNIRDGQGKVKDYVDYFTHSGISKAEADSRGLISRSIGQRAFAIASQGSDELKTLHRNDLISDQAAADIANLSPNNSAMQAVGLRVLQEHKPLNNALNTMRAVMALTREKGQEPETFDLFGFDDSAMKEAEAMAKIASRKQRLIAEQLTAIKGAVKNPKLAAKHGVIVENEADALAKVQAMTAQKARWDNWSSYSDLLAEVRSELADSHNSLSQSDYGDDDAAYWFWRETVDCFNSQQADTSKDIQTLEEAEAYW